MHSGIKFVLDRNASLAVVAIVWLSLCSTGLSQTVTVDPTAAMRFSPPVEKNVLVQYATPAGWHRWNEGGGFFPNRDKDYPVIVLQVGCHVESEEQARYNANRPEWMEDPKYTFAFETLRESSPIRSIKKVGSFSGKPNGKLKLWRLHADSYDMYVVLIVDGHVNVEVNLRCDDRKLLQQCLKVLKEEARSVRIIRQAGIGA